MSTLNANHDLLAKRRRKTRLTALRENRELSEVRAIEKEAENERKQIEMREEIQQNLFRIKLLYIEKQKLLATKQEEDRQRKIQAENDERKRIFIETRRLARELERKKTIDAARKKAEELIESNEAHLIKKKIELEKLKSKTELQMKEKEYWKTLRMQEVDDRKQEIISRIKQVKDEKLIVKQKLNENKKRTFDHKVNLVNLEKQKTMNFSRSLTQIYDIEFTNDRKAILKNKQLESEAKLIADEQAKFKASEKAQRKLDEEAWQIEQKKWLEDEKKRKKELDILLAEQEAKEESEREALREEERLALDEYIRQAEEEERVYEFKRKEEIRIKLAVEKERERRKLEKILAEAEKERQRLLDEQQKQKQDKLENILNEIQNKAVEDYLKKVDEKKRISELYKKNREEWRSGLTESLEQAKKNYKNLLMNSIPEKIEEEKSDQEEEKEENIEKYLKIIKKKAAELSKKKAKEFLKSNPKSSIDSYIDFFSYNPNDLVSILGSFSTEPTERSFYRPNSIISREQSTIRTETRFPTLDFLKEKNTFSIQKSFQRTLTTIQHTTTTVNTTQLYLPIVNSNEKLIKSDNETNSNNAEDETDMEIALRNIKLKAKELTRLKIKEKSKISNNDYDYESYTQEEREFLLKNIKQKARELSTTRLSLRQSTSIQINNQFDEIKLNKNYPTDTLNNKETNISASNEIEDFKLINEKDLIEKLNLNPKKIEQNGSSELINELETNSEENKAILNNNLKQSSRIARLTIVNYLKESATKNKTISEV